MCISFILFDTIARQFPFFGLAFALISHRAREGGYLCVWIRYEGGGWEEDRGWGMGNEDRGWGMRRGREMEDEWN